MSVKRYTACGSGVVRVDPKGELVSLKDYLELKQQPDALTAYLYAAELAKDHIKKLKAELTDCKAKADRLKDAGDNLVTLVSDLNNLMDMSNEHPEVLAWEAAKKR